MPVHAEVEGFLKMLADAGTKGFHEMEPVECREAFSGLLAMLPPSSAKIAGTEDRSIPGPAGDVPIRIFTPEGTGPFPVLVYFHGGGFVIGSLDDYNSICQEVCSLAGCVVVAVDYRLAPEHKFPAAPDDCYAATQWVAENAASISVDAQRIAVGGDSAGGNLAAVVSRLARDNNGPTICAQLLIYPVTNGGDPMPSMSENAEGYLLTAKDMEWFVGHYAGSASDLSDPRLDALGVKDLSNLPPAWVTTCEFDPLRDEGEAYAAALSRNGVSTTIRRSNGNIHGAWTFFTAMSPGRAMMDDACQWLKGRFNPA